MALLPVNRGALLVASRLTPEAAIALLLFLDIVIPRDYLVVAYWPMFFLVTPPTALPVFHWLF